MTFDKIHDAFKHNTHLYIDENEVEVLFFDRLTEVIEVRFIKDDRITAVTEASLSLKKKMDIIIQIGDGLIWRVGKENVQM